MNLNLRELLAGRTSQLRNIVRYSNGPRHHDESVAEHSYYTAFYALVMCEVLRKNKVHVDTNLAIRKAVLHDLDECISGDFVRSFKMSRPGLCEAIETAAASQIPELFLPILQNDSVMSSSLAEEAATGKGKDCLEGQVVAFADFLSVLAYAIQEVDTGNAAIVRHLVGLTKYLKSFQKLELFKFEVAMAWYAEAERILERFDDRHILLEGRW